MDNSSPSGVSAMTCVELKARLDSGEKPILVDVREPFERDIADLPEIDQLRIPVGEIATRMDEIPRDREVILYCRSGARSQAVGQLLVSMGFSDVVNLTGGVLGWRADVDPTLEAY